MGRPDFTGRINIKYIYISSYTERAKRCSVFDIAILTEDLKYIEYEIQTNKTEITPKVQAQYHSLLSDWQVTGSTKIYFHENVGLKEPVRMLFKALAQQFKIRQHTFGTDKMIRRLCHIHANFINRRDKKTGQYVIKRHGKKYFLNQVWRKVVKTGLCPWITKAYDEHLTARGYREIIHRKKLVRLGMYYILESNVKCGYDRKKKNTSIEQVCAPAQDVYDETPEEYKSGLFS